MIAFDIQVAVGHGEAGPQVREYLERKLRRALDRAPATVLYVRAHLDKTDNPSVERPIDAAVIADLNGDIVRAEAAGTTWTEAVDLLEDKLVHELEHLKERRHARRVRPAERRTDAWRHGDAANQRPDHYPRSADERQIVPRQTWIPVPSTVPDAVAEMRRLGHEFQLFVEEGSGTPAVVAVGPDGSLELTVADDTPTLDGLAAQVEIRRGVPRMDVDQAIWTLEASGLPYVFFIDRETGRGTVVHHRYDGHLGLVTSESVPV
jgi:ribosomal subunit interface protein